MDEYYFGYDLGDYCKKTNRQGDHSAFSIVRKIENKIQVLEMKVIPADEWKKIYSTVKAMGEIYPQVKEHTDKFLKMIYKTTFEVNK
jgi:hypothetical protein